MTSDVEVAGWRGPVFRIPAGQSGGAVLGKVHLELATTARAEHEAALILSPKGAKPFLAGVLQLETRCLAQARVIFGEAGAGGTGVDLRKTSPSENQGEHRGETDGDLHRNSIPSSRFSVQARPATRSS
jgi:hypothetical protein